MSGLPEGWINVLLSDVAQWGSGGTPSRANSTYYGGDIPWVKTGELGQGLIKDTEERITNLGLQNSSAKIFPQGAVLIAMYGATIGKTAILGIDAATNQACAVGIPRESITTTEYLFYYLTSQREAFIEVGQGGAQPNISQKVIKDWTIPLAPFNEQERITNKLNLLLTRVDACRDRLDLIPRILKCFRQSILAAATSGRLTQDWRDTISTEDLDPDSNALPSGWKWKLIREVGSIQLGRQRAPRYHSGQHMRSYLRVQNIFEDRIDLSDVMEMDFPPEDFEKYQLAYGDILLNEGQSPEFLGRPAMYRDELPGVCFTNTLIRFRAADIVNRDFALLVFRHYMHCGRFSREGKITTNIAHLSAGRFGSIEFPLPPLDEQQEIVRRASSLFAYADRLEARYQKALKRVEKITFALLSTAFRGELVPQDPDGEPASALLERIQAERLRMKSEQKTTRTARRTKKEEPKAPVRHTLGDYVKALRSAFERLEGEADARQLFDQAGFNPEETVQFYEALRAIPEVRDAFKKPVQEQLPEEQSLVAKISDNSLSENGHFRLIELWLEDFKNLTDYTVRFDPSHSIDIVLGWNGTGKSNLFEALVIIFRDLHRWSEKNQWTQKPMKGYRLRYEINGGTVEVSWKPGEMKRPKLRMETPQKDEEKLSKTESITREKLPLPRFVFGYYSGPTNRLAEHFLPMKQDHYSRLLEATSDDPKTLTHLLEQRRFFCAENHHAKYVLLAFCHKEDADISRFLEDRLRIMGFESALFIIRKPRWAKGNSAEDFWGATGIMRRVMERLR